MNIVDAKNSVLMVATPVVLTCLSSDLEIQWQVGVGAGRHNCGQWIPLMGSGDTLELPDDGNATFLQPALGRHVRMAFGDGSHDTGANQKFQPKRATDLELQMRKMTDALASRADNLERRQARIERMSVERQDVIDKEAEALDAAEAVAEAERVEKLRKAQVADDLASAEAADALKKEKAAPDAKS